MNAKKLYLQVYSVEQFQWILSYFSGENVSFDFLSPAERDVFTQSFKFIEEVWLLPYKGFVFWNEFCEHLFTKIWEIENIFALLPQEKEIIIETSLLTKYNRGYYETLFSLFLEKNISFQVVINDFWYLSLLQSLWFQDMSKIIIGRLLLKPRKIFNIHNKIAQKVDDLSLNSPVFQAFYKKLWISKFSVDILPQWTLVHDKQDAFLYFPWGYYTSSRGCVTQSTFSGKNYIYPLSFCHRPCEDTYIQFPNQPHLIWKGNSVFYKSLSFMNIQDFSSYENFIFQPFLPR